MSAESIIGIISDIAKRISATDISAAEIYLYVAGVPSEQTINLIRDTFQTHLSVTKLSIESDLLGAARAVCGHKPGIAAILGTGSNSCMYDGEQIIKRVYSGGFILGDEGSAATLGKLFISDFLKGIVPDEIATEFSVLYPTDYTTIVSNVYHSNASPSGYLGSFAPFILKHYDNPYIKELIKSNFRSFIRRALRQYDIQTLEVGIVGGFGYATKDIFLNLAKEENIRISRFISHPIEGLIEYHLQ
jgi:N-acetylglucosamine kinase-like BadF-type ATPase